MQFMQTILHEDVLHKKGSAAMHLYYASILQQKPLNDHYKFLVWYKEKLRLFFHFQIVSHALSVH